ncbi:MAG: immunity protein TriTu family protein, partial [Nitrososphaerales archaeon]
MDVLLERIPSLIEELERIRLRPHVHISKIESESLRDYLSGFREAAHLFAYMKYWEKYLRIVEQVAYDRGWPMVLDFVKSIRASGLSEKEIIEEMLFVEIESWKRLAALIPSDKKSDSASLGRSIDHSQSSDLRMDMPAPSHNKDEAMLDEFENWFSTHQSYLKEKGFSVRVVRPNFEDKKYAFADINNEDVLARVFVLDSGEYEQGATEIETGEAKLAESHVCKTPNDLVAFLEEFLKKL